MIYEEFVFRLGELHTVFAMLKVIENVLKKVVCIKYLLIVKFMEKRLKVHSWWKRYKNER